MSKSNTVIFNISCYTRFFCHHYMLIVVSPCPDIRCWSRAIPNPIRHKWISAFANTMCPSVSFFRRIASIWSKFNLIPFVLRFLSVFSLEVFHFSQFGVTLWEDYKLTIFLEPIIGPWRLLQRSNWCCHFLFICRPRCSI